MAKKANPPSNPKSPASDDVTQALLREIRDAIQEGNAAQNEMVQHLADLVRGLTPGSTAPQNAERRKK